MSNLVPFGRYRGKPVEDLVADRGYCDWLMHQDWFVRRFPDMKVLMMNFGQPEAAETPEHNAMQARFLNESIRRDVLTISYPSILKTAHNAKFAKGLLYYVGDDNWNHYPGNFYCVDHDASDTDVVTPGCEFTYLKKTFSQKETKASFVFDKTCGEIVCNDPVFEDDGWDVSYTFGIRCSILVTVEGSTKRVFVRNCYEHQRRDVNLPTVYIELKPSVSDDYPVVLRQIKKNMRQRGGYFVLACGQFSSSVVTWAQVQKIFASSGITAIILPPDTMRPGDDVFPGDR